MPKKVPLTDLTFDRTQRARLMKRIGEIRKFAPLLAKARKPEGAGEPNDSEIDAARKLLERLRDEGIFTVDSQEVIASALGMKPHSLVSQVLEVQPTKKLARGDGSFDLQREKQSSAFVAWVGSAELVNLVIVFTDIIDSTRLNNQFGISGWDTIRSAHFSQAEKFLRQHQGFLIKTIGDSVMAAFKNSVNALLFARALECDPGHAIVRIRAGVHSGQVQIKAGDAFGPDVNLAARISGKPEYGGIWVSDRVHDDWLKNDPTDPLPWTEHSDVELKGFSNRFTLWSLLPTKGGSQPERSRPKPVSPEALREFLNAVITECAPLKLKAINQSAATPGTKPLGLTSVYVDLNLDLRISTKLSLAKHLEAQNRGTSESNLRGDPEQMMERDRETRLVPVLEALAHHQQLVLLGAPGSGKSTLVAYVALSLAESAAGQGEALKRLGKWWSFGALLPVRVVLRHFAVSLPRDLDRGRAKHLWDFIEDDLQKSGLTAAAAAVPRQVAPHAGALFLFDGLDEVREEAARARMLEAVAEFARLAGPNCRFLLTARPYAWDDFKDPKSAPPGSTPAQLAEMNTAYRLADFELEQIRTFVEHWYKAIQSAGWPVSDPAKKLEELKQAVQRSDLSPLARNPLLLTLMATLHSNRATLPDDRADLYHEVVELLLQRWNENVGATRGLLDALAIPTLTLSHLRKVIQNLAFEAHTAHVGKEGVADIPEGALLHGLRPLLANDTGKADLALHYIEERAGLLLGQGERGSQRQYTFPHRTFQEYLAACHLAGRNDFCKKAATIARENPAHWREVLTLAARRAEADRGVPAADALVHCLSFKEWSEDHAPTDLDWRVAVLAAEQLLEIGLAAVASDENHRVVRDRVAGWLGALLNHGGLSVKERAQAGVILGKLGDFRTGVGLRSDGLPDIDWIRIPEGKFQMGGQERWQGGQQFECGLLEKHSIHISRYPITVAQYQAFVEAKGYEDDRPYGKEGFWTDAAKKWRKSPKGAEPENYDPVFQTPNHPRVGVSWFEAVAFCRWLTEKLKDGSSRREAALTSGKDGASFPRLLPGDEIRLPSEAEWERAARGTEGRAYPWGKETDFAERCNMAGTGIGHTSAVGLFPTGDTPREPGNNQGIADMAGNVWEWCRTQWTDDYKEYEKKAQALDDLEGESARVLRGASWFFGNPVVLVSSYRDDNVPGFRNYDVGFRVVLVGVSVR